MANRVVITGLGCISPIGNTMEEIRSSIRGREVGIDSISSFDSSNFQVGLAAEVKNLDYRKYMSKKEVNRLDRVDIFGIIAAMEAIIDSGLDIESINKDRAGVIVSSGIGGLESIERQYIRGMDKGFERISPFFIPMAITNTTASYIASSYGFHGSCYCPVTACAGSTSAIGMGFREIKDGYLDLVVVGGSEASISKLGIGGFSSMKALSKSKEKLRASIPFDLERSGFVMGEGAGILVLENLELAKKRGAKIYGEVLGYGSTCDAGHVTQPHMEGIFAKKAMEMAIKEAGISPKDIDYISAHGTSTELNDLCETRAIKDLFKNDYKDIPVSSIKSSIGHLLAASGAVESIITFLALEEGTLPVNLNFKLRDPACDLNIVKDFQEARVRHFLKNSLGFGGHNVSLVYRRWEKNDT